MEFRLWGPIEVAGNGSVLVIRPPQQAAVLAALAVDAGRQVSNESLLSRIWDEEPPAQARRTVHTYLTRIRRSLEQAGALEHGVRLTHRGNGYLLELGSATVDLLAFQGLVAQARHPGCPAARRMELLTEALSSCRGEPLAGMPGGWAAQVREGLRQQRLDAVLAWATAALLCGRATETVGPLIDLVGEHPLVESAVAALMRALQATGRSADALDRYTQARQRLAEQLGIDPGPELRSAHREVLAAGPQPLPALAPERAPAQLPLDVAGFAGRDSAMAELDDLLAGSRRSPAAVTVVAVSGTAGVGKTALAVHWAHRHRGHFPAGQLFADLRGYGPGSPVRPVEALARFLVALGMPAAEVPAGEEAAADAYRSLLAERRVLVVLDNVATADQVRPLLPAGAGSFVLVTSREQLGGLVAREGARSLTLEVLRPEESRALITGLLGDARLAAEPAAAQRLTEVCAHLPLALRIAAAHLVFRPGETITGYTGRLDPADRVTALQIEGDEQTAVRFAFDRSYATLPRDARRVFRLIGLNPGADLTSPAAAVLAGVPVAEAERLLDRLTAAHLVQPYRPGRFICHDLLRLYAAGRAEAEDAGEERDAAVGRLLEWQLSTAEAAIRLLYPEKRRVEAEKLPGPAAAGFTDKKSALDWLEAERANLVSSARFAAGSGPHRYAWQLAGELRAYFWNAGHAPAWQAMNQAGLIAAEVAGDLQAQTAMRLNSGALSWRQDRYDAAIEHYRAALGLARRLGRRDLETDALSSLGAVFRQAGRLDDAIGPLREAMVLEQDQGTLRPGTVGRLGSVHWELGQLQEAAEMHARALTMYRTIDSAAGQAVALANLGETHLLRGKAGPAAEHLSQALGLYREIGNRDGESEALCGLAVAYSYQDRAVTALDMADAALETARQLGRIRSLAGALNAVGHVHLRAGRPAEAARCLAEALDLAREIDHRYPEADTLALLASARLHLGEPECALALAEEALAIAAGAGYRIVEGRARGVLAAAWEALGRGEPAETEVHRARRLRDQTGYGLPPLVLEPR
ncbi:tetratricopeptide repeat protein [Actinoplanes sp. KI2]|uniref:AfsR/SARP family transcriptional regulator n=1 Tax=Actinoplanes sp. KI2 TaxID=2983315 RepID=UPI0021D5BE5B|nr:AfsR/SARP family transcriptional regulator [Actinoplanes sp. KI2]MCU7731128.1 tetratricopeptide repeat protein [Actinoplanes sp. KI2]